MPVAMEPDGDAVAAVQDVTTSYPTVLAVDMPSSWKAAERGWGHSLHKLAPYVGRFPAALARFFILNLSDPGQVVFDPWSGGGTTALEALLCDRAAVASDAFAYAYTLSHAKGNPMTYGAFDAYLRDKLAEARRVTTRPHRMLDNPHMRVSFSDRTLADILRLRHVMAGDTSAEALFLKAVIAGILHGPTKSFLSAPQKDQTSSSPAYIKRFLAANKVARPVRDIYTCAMAKAERSLDHALPTRRATVLRADSRALPLPDGSVDLVVTSPPYMEVLDYPWNNWVRLWWLGEDRLKEAGKLMQSGREIVYRAFMRASLAELYRVMRPDSAAVIVIGDVNRKAKQGLSVSINSALLVAEEARPLGFAVDTILNDMYGFQARSMLVQNMLKWGYSQDDHGERSSVRIDRCLVLCKGTIAWRHPSIAWQSMKRGADFLIPGR